MKFKTILTTFLIAISIFLLTYLPKPFSLDRFEPEEKIKIAFLNIYETTKNITLIKELESILKYTSLENELKQKYFNKMWHNFSTYPEYYTVLPHELVKIRLGDFYSILNNRKKYLLTDKEEITLKNISDAVELIKERIDTFNEKAFIEENKELSNIILDDYTKFETLFNDISNKLSLKTNSSEPSTSGWDTDESLIDYIISLSKFKIYKPIVYAPLKIINNDDFVITGLARNIILDSDEDIYLRALSGMYLATYTDQTQLLNTLFTLLEDITKEVKSTNSLFKESKLKFNIFVLRLIGVVVRQEKERLLKEASKDS